MNQRLVVDGEVCQSLYGWIMLTDVIFRQNEQRTSVWATLCKRRLLGALRGL